MIVSKLLLLLFMVTAWPGQAQETPRRYNVVYISVEDMWPSLACYGDPVAYSPHLDRFAEEAVLFEDVHCQVALCTPSRTSILTGIRPSTSGIVKIDDDWQAILPNATSLPRHFRNQGYYTALAGKIHDLRSGGTDSAYSKVYEAHGVDNNDFPLQALEDVATRDQPFFLAIGYSQAHDPWTPTPGARQHYAPDQFTVQGRENNYQGQEYTDEGVRELMQGYYGEVTEVDSLIGGLLARIKALDLYDESIILVGAFDHGYSLGHREHWGKGNCYDDETMVPMLVRIPGNDSNGQRTSGLVELVDVYPTLLDLCNLPPPPQSLEGTSFRPLLEKPKQDWKHAVFTHRAYAVDIVGVKTKQYNLINFAGDSVQLFDRKADPFNLRDISNTYPEIVRQMQEIQEEGWKKMSLLH